MPSRRFPTIKDEVSKKKRTRSYDVRVGCQQYSNIAGLLAGFAFTIVILVAQENSSSLNDAEIISRNIAAIGFFVSFFGCVIASFIFALISGEEALTPRANQMAFFAGAAFSLNISLLFWGISAILKTFLVKEVALIAYQIFPLFLIIHPIYVVASILDNIYIFDRRELKLGEYLITMVPSFITIVFFWLLRIDGVTINTALNLQFFFR